jgi:cytochrome c
VIAGAPAPIAPNLAGVVGRKAASTGYNYSPALKASGLVWTKPKLDAFLSGPQQLVPGTRMAVRVADPADRAAIIDFLTRSGR